MDEAKGWMYLAAAFLLFVLALATCQLTGKVSDYLDSQTPKEAQP